ncbi:MAG: hypothetical protein WCF85_07115 [Rhodospirillaceae bacterium]
MPVPVAEAVEQIVRNAATTKGAAAIANSATGASMVKAGAAGLSNLGTGATGAAGAKTAALGGILSGKGFGLGFGLGYWGPVLVFAAGAVSVYGYGEFRKRQVRARRTRRIFGAAPSRPKKRLFSVLGFSLWR